MRFGIVSEAGYFAKRNLDRGKNAWGFAWTSEQSEALISDDLKYITEVMEQTRKKLTIFEVSIVYFYNESDYDRQEYEKSGEAEKAGTLNIAREMEKYYTDKAVRLMVRYGMNKFDRYDFPSDWKRRFTIEMRIRIVDQITDEMMNTEKYPLDNRYICIHYLEDEADRIIYTTDLKAVWSAMDYMSDLYYHEENQRECTPYDRGTDEEDCYRSSNRDMDPLIYPVLESEDYFVKMRFYSC